MAGEWSIQDLAKAAGTTSRTLRHYGQLGLLEPSRIGANGYRYYDQHSLVRLQRILLLRELGLGLPVIAEVLAGEQDTAGALRTHLELLRQQQDRIARQIESVSTTLHKTERGEPLMAAEVFDGFDHTQYKDEVEQRWGEDAYARSATWWESKTRAEQRDWQRAQAERNRAWIELARTGASPKSPDAQELAAGHVRWLAGIPGTPAASADPATLKAYVLGLADMYVADDRFAAHYGGRDGAGFVRAALRHYAATNL